MAKQKQENNNSHEPNLWDAIDVKEIATKLINESTFVFPKNTPILYLFAQKMGNGKWGKCSKCSDAMEVASGYRFVITINHAQWLLLTEKQREACVFQQLINIGYNSEKDKYCIVKPDIIEFNSVVKKYGLYRDNIIAFTNIAVDAIK